MGVLLNAATAAITGTFGLWSIFSQGPLDIIWRNGFTARTVVGLVFVCVGVYFLSKAARLDRQRIS